MEQPRIIQEKLSTAARQRGAVGRLLFYSFIALSSPGWVANAQPTNDSFDNRAPISGMDANVSGSLAGATSETGEPLITGVSSGQTAWWTWTARSNGIVTLSASGNGFSPLLAVYTGEDLANLSLVASNSYLICYEHTNCGCHWRVRDQMTFHVTRGQAYQVALDSAVVTDVQWIPEFISDAVTPLAGAVLAFGATPIEIEDGGTATTYRSYYIPLPVTNILAGADLSLQLHLTPAPTNDDFEKRIVVRGSRLRIPTSNAGAGKQPGEPNHLGNPGGSSVWYSWTAAASGRVTLSANEIPIFAPPSWSDGYGSYSLDASLTLGFPGPPDCGSAVEANPLPTFFPLLAAYTGSSLESLTPAGCLPLSLPAYPNAVEFDAVKGQSYQIAFDGNMGTTSDITLYLALTKPAKNDSFANRIRLHGIYVNASSYNAGATQQGGEPALGVNSSRKTVWWSWTAPVSGTVSIDLGGSDYVFPVAVFTGGTVSTLQPVAAGTGRVVFDAVEGRTYQIAVGDAAGLTGAIKLSLQGPIVDAALERVQKRSEKTALLRYAASPGQMLLLLRSDDDLNWRKVRTGVAHGSEVEFSVHPAPAAAGPWYRAIIVDRVACDNCPHSSSERGGR